MSTVTGTVERGHWNKAGLSAETSTLLLYSHVKGVSSTQLHQSGSSALSYAAPTDPGTSMTRTHVRVSTYVSD